MITKVKIKDENGDPFADNFVEIDLKPDCKILSEEPYVKELYDLYEGRDPEEYSMKSLTSGNTVDAVITSINKNTVALEVDKKNTVHLNLTKENKDFIEYIEIGNKIPVKLNKNSRSSEFTASYTDAVKDKKHNDIKESIGKPVAFNATVKELIHGGYYLDIDGITVFMPGSLAGINKLWDFDALINTQLIVMPINFSKEKNTIVVSHREYLKTLMPSKIEQIREKIMDEYEGEVTGATDFGVFAQFNECLTGLIPVAELNEASKEDFNNKRIKPGYKIKFYIKDIISEKKIILTQLEDNPWKEIDKKYKPNSKTQGTVIGIKNYGAFIKLEENIIGLIPYKDIKNDNIKEGDTINILITRIDVGNRKIELKKV